jgi:AraC family transcriptional regulator
MLLREDMPVVRIATACGFSSQSHLTRVFKTAVGTTPAVYRAASRERQLTHKAKVLQA